MALYLFCTLFSLTFYLIFLKAKLMFFKVARYIVELDTIYRDFLLADFLRARSPHGHKVPIEIS